MYELFLSNQAVSGLRRADRVTYQKIVEGCPSKGRTMSDPLVSVEEIAEYLGVSKDTVYGWITKKEMPAHKVGRLWKFKTDEVDDWVSRLLKKSALDPVCRT